MFFTTKNDVRKYIKTHIPPLDIKENKDKRINEKLISSPYYKKASCVLSYMALKDEVFIDNSKIDKDIFIPKVDLETTTMNFYKYTNDTILENGAYNITEPKENSNKFSFNKSYENILVIVPGRAFTKEGKRIGRGKGYYDKFLSLLLQNYNKDNVTLLGIAYKEQILEDIPFESHDIKMDLVITD